jgi:hypothetical protein
MSHLFFQWSSLTSYSTRSVFIARLGSLSMHFSNMAAPFLSTEHNLGPCKFSLYFI